MKHVLVVVIASLSLGASATLTGDGRVGRTPVVDMQASAGTYRAATSVAPHATMRVGIDPTTREFVEPENPIQPEDLPVELRDALRASGGGLTPVQNPVSGGVMVDLQGQFMNFQYMTIDAEGRVTAPCVPVLPAERRSDTPETSAGGE